MVGFLELFQVRGLQIPLLNRSRNDVFFRGPITKVDYAAAVAAKRHVGIVESNLFLADRASHRRCHYLYYLTGKLARGGLALRIGNGFEASTGAVYACSGASISSPTKS